MSRNGQRIQLTVRLDPDVYQAAKEVERRTFAPLSRIIADAARETLLSAQQATISQQLQDLSNRLLQRLTTIERALGSEIVAVKELTALWARSYFNHTPAIPEPERTVASLSGRKRFVQLVEFFNRNLQQGVSILNELESNNAAEQRSSDE